MSKASQPNELEARRSDTLPASFLALIKSWDDPGDQKAEPERQAAAQAIAVVHRSDGSGTTFIWTDYLSEVEREVEIGCRFKYVGRMARRHRRQRQRGRFQQCEPDQGLDRLCGIRVRETERHDYGEHDEQGWQDGCRRTRPPSKPLPPMRTGEKARGFYVILTNQSGRGFMADRTAATFILIYKQPHDPAAAAKPSNSLPGPMPRATRWPRHSITFRCRKNRHSRSRSMWAKEITDASGKPLHTTHGAISPMQPAGPAANARRPASYL